MAMLLASQGAKFRGSIQKVKDQFRASYEVILNVGGATRTESDARLFDTTDQAESWLQAESTLRGFD
jgi:hypothetical protein